MNWNIDKTNKQFKPNIQWMSEKYHEMNQLLFNGKLGKCNFDIFTKGRGSQGRTLGFFQLQTQTLCNRYTGRMFVKDFFGTVEISIENFFDICQPKIALNGNYSGTEYAFLNTLVHEMCHYYTYMRGYAPKQPHGTEFKYIAEYVCLKSNGFINIQRLASAEEMENYVLSNEIKEKKSKREENKKSNITAVFDFKTNGEVRLTTTSDKKLIDTICNYDKKVVPSDKIVLSKDINLINLLFEKGYKINFRTWRYYNVENKEWLNMLNNMHVEVIKQNNSSFNENKRNLSTNKIIKEVLNNFIKSKKNNPFIEINPDMNLGTQSPLENL